MAVFHIKLLFPEFFQNSSTSGPGSRWSTILRVGLSPSAEKDPTVSVIVISLGKKRYVRFKLLRVLITLLAGCRDGPVVRALASYQLA